VKDLQAFLQTLTLGDAVVIEGVKWRRQPEDPQIYPAADTDQFGKLPALNRGTLIFIPDPEDHGPVRDRFS
jgi:hypothetical protein